MMTVGRVLLQKIKVSKIKGEAQDLRNLNR
jgi:hypothetical protein